MNTTIENFFTSGLRIARARRHALLTAEHVLYALVGDEEARIERAEQRHPVQRHFVEQQDREETGDRRQKDGQPAHVPMGRHLPLHIKPRGVLTLSR